MTNDEIIKKILDLVNFTTDPPIAYIKYPKPPQLGGISPYRPDKWTLILANRETNPEYDNRQKSFEVNSYNDGIEILESTIHKNIISKKVKCIDSHDYKYYVILHWN